MTDAHSAARPPLIAVFGGAGFVGRHVARALAERGWRIRVASRQPQSHAFPILPQPIEFVRAEMRDPAALAAAVRGADAVINLTGILTESGQQTFDSVHRLGAAALAEAASAAGIENFVHVSAIGADPHALSAYGRSKYAGEQAVLAALPHAVIVRPSIIFGPEDDFFNRFAKMARVSPALPVIGGGRTLFQPVYVGDVAAMIAGALEGQAQSGAVYELGGPEQRSFGDLLRYICFVIGKKRLMLPIPFAIAPLVAGGIELADRAAFGHFPKMLLMTRDQVASLRVDNVVSDAAVKEGRTLQAVGIAPRSIEAIVPTYLV